MMTTWQQSLIATSSTPFRLLPSMVVEAPHLTQVTTATGCPLKNMDHADPQMFSTFPMFSFWAPQSSGLGFIHSGSQFFTFCGYFSLQTFSLWWGEGHCLLCIPPFILFLYAWHHQIIKHTNFWIRSKNEYCLTWTSSYKWLFNLILWEVIRLWRVRTIGKKTADVRRKVIHALASPFLFCSWGKQQQKSFVMRFMTQNRKLFSSIIRVNALHSRKELACVIAAPLTVSYKYFI